jgi:Domain of unknown function (DUF4136)
MTALRVVPALAAVLFASVTLLAQEIHTDFDHSANFSQYHTYSWAKVHSDDALFQQRIVNDVDSALQKLGLQKVDSGGDLSVAAVGAVRNQQEYQTFYDGFGGGWRWGGFGDVATTTPINYRVGTLVVDLYDTRTKRLVWRGTATETLSGDPSKNVEKLKSAVSKMLDPDKFPPPLGSLKAKA